MENIDLYPQAEVLKKSWPMASSSLLIEVKRGDKVFTSSAVAIGDRMVLTAAHAVDQLDSAQILLGDNYQEISQKIDVQRCIIHPGYKPSKSFYENDLSIVLLKEDLPKEIKRESIFPHHKLIAGEALERIGFGMRGGINKRNFLAPLFRGQTFNLKNFILKDTDSVLGDSGGPIYFSHQGELRLLGLHSTLEGKDKTYIVNLAYYHNWIEMNRPSNFYADSSIHR